MLEANAAMKSMVHKVLQKTWRKYLLKLANEVGIENPSDDDLRRLDQKRKRRRFPRRTGNRVSRERDNESDKEQNTRPAFQPVYRRVDTIRLVRCPARRPVMRDRAQIAVAATANRARQMVAVITCGSIIST